ncbi:MAG: hypothetical protein PVG38_10550 [Gammaproteobacteria bacterium]
MLSGLFAGFLVVGAQAAFVLVENFDMLRPGGIHGQNNWSDADNSGQVVADPAGGANQALEVDTESGALYRALRVSEGASRLLFLRLRFEEHDVYSFGLSPRADPTEYNDFGPELGMAAATASDPNNDLRVANGSIGNVYDVLDTLTPDTWYNLWVMIDNSADTYQVWLNTDLGAPADSDDLLDNDAANTVFGFRLAGSADLVNFFIKTGGGPSPVAGRLYLDDIYLEDTGALNLENPGPGGTVDSNGDGISDADAIRLGLDPDDPDGDTDNDTFTDVDEVGPDVEDPLDSDVDGVINALEPGNTAFDASVASGLLLASGDRVTITAPNQSLSQVSAAPVTDGPTGFDFPFGAISYVTTSPPGGAVTVQMDFSVDLPTDLSLYKQDNAGLLTELPTIVWLRADSSRIDVTLADGDPQTDLERLTEGFIRDPLALATPTSPTAFTSTGGDGGCALGRAARRDAALPLLLLALLGYGCSRGRRRVPRT